MTQQFIFRNFEMNDLGEASNYVLGIEIHWDKFENILDLSHKATIERVLEKLIMHDVHLANASPMHIVKID